MSRPRAHCDTTVWLGRRRRGSTVSLPKKTVAAVTVGQRKTELREFDIPEVGPGGALLQVEAAGVCGADVNSYNADKPARIMGHENVGFIAAIGELAADRWGLQEGDRVALEEYLPCGHCNFCRSSDFRMCLASDARSNPNALRYGTTPISTPPALWGGYSQYMYLHPRSVLHRVDSKVPAVEASLALPLGNGYEWAYVEGGVGPGETVVILGPGQQGLGCVLAAREAGATNIIVTGLRRDKARLGVAALLGAHHTIYADDGPLREQVHALTDGAMADLVIDTAAGDERTVPGAIESLTKRGRFCFAASTTRPLDNVPFGDINRKSLTVKGVRGHSYGAVEWALSLIASRRYPLASMCSLERPLSGVHEAILGTGGELDLPVIHAAVLPGAE